MAINKLSALANVDYTDEADIEQLWSVVQSLITKTNEVIDTVNEHDTDLDNAVYYEED